MSLDSIELSDSDFDDVMSDGLAELLKEDESVNDSKRKKNTKSNKPKYVPQRYVSVRVRVPESTVGLVVGLCGQTIQQIQSATNTFIKAPTRLQEPIFEITGDRDNVNVAISEVQARIPGQDNIRVLETKGPKDYFEDDREQDEDDSVEGPEMTSRLRRVLKDLAMLTLNERAKLQEILRMVNNDKKHSDWSKEFGCQFNSDERKNGLNTTVKNDRQPNSEHPWSEKKVETLLGDSSTDEESIQTFHVDKEDLVASEDDSVEGNLFIAPDPSIDILEDVTDEPIEDDKDYDFIDLMEEIECAFDGIEWIDMSVISSVICVPNLLHKMNCLYDNTIRNRKWQAGALRAMISCAKNRLDENMRQYFQDKQWSLDSQTIRDYYCQIHDEVMHFIDEFQKWKIQKEIQDTENPKKYFSSKNQSARDKFILPDYW